MKIIAYLRVSTDEQAESGLGMESQSGQIAFWRDQNHPAPTFHIQYFRDEGRSGSLPPEKRPGLTAAIAALEKGDLFVVAKRDRIARDFVITAMIEGVVKARGATLISLDASNEDTPEGWLNRAILDVFAQYERLIIAFRTKAALAVKKKNGERVGAIPYGKDLAEDGKTLVENPKEHTILAYIRRQSELGRSLRRIASNLTGLKVPTKNGKKEWTHQVIARILAREDA